MWTCTASQIWLEPGIFNSMIMFLQEMDYSLFLGSSGFGWVFSFK